jgi:hypothetical protein
MAKCTNCGIEKSEYNHVTPTGCAGAWYQVAMHVANQVMASIDYGGNCLLGPNGWPDYTTVTFRGMNTALEATKRNDSLEWYKQNFNEMVRTKNNDSSYNQSVNGPHDDEVIE